MQPAMPQNSALQQPGQLAPQGQPAAPPQLGRPSPEEQQMYDTVVGQSEEYVYGQGRANVEKRLQAGAEDGVEDDVGAVVGNLLAMNYQGAQQAGKTIPPKVMIGAAKELTEVVTDIAVEMKLINPQEADAAADEALYVAISTFGKMASPHMPEEERQQYTQIVQTIRATEEQAKGSGQAQQPIMQGGVQPSGY